MNSAQINSTQSRFGLLQIVIILLALITTVVHLVILNIQLGELSILFTLNGLGYLALLVLYLLPIPIARNNRNLIRWALILYSAVTILAWIPRGQRSFLGYFTKLDELVLIVLLWFDRGQQPT